MDRPAILKTSRPGVPGRVGDVFWVSIAVCSSGTMENERDTYTSFSLHCTRSAKWEQRPKRVRTFKNGSPLGQKMDEPWANVPLEKPLHIWYTVPESCK